MDANIKVVPVDEQSRDIFYKIKMRFKVSVGLKEINDFMADFGFNEKVIARDVAELYLEQVIPFVPDDDIIAKYVDTLKQNYLKDNPNLEIYDCVFDGYEYFYAVKYETEDEEFDDKEKGFKNELTDEFLDILYSKRGV